MESADRKILDHTAQSVELFQEGKYQDAETGFAACVAMAREANASAALLCEALNNFSIALFALSRFSDAESVLKEALALCQTEPASETMQIMRACSLNSRARLNVEFERYPEGEADLQEAVELVRALHPVYAAEMSGNLVRLYALVPEWKSKIKPVCADFESLHAANEQLEVYLDDLAGWRRPGKSWDRMGGATPESITARVLSNRTHYLYESRQDSKADYQAILDLDEQTKQVPPHMVIHAYLSLAELAFLSADYNTACKLSEDALRVASSSYLRDHPSNFSTLLKAVSFSIIGGSPEKNRGLFDAAVDIVSKYLGESNPHYAKCLAARTFMLPFFSVNSSDLSNEQLKTLRRCLSIFRMYYDDGHSWIVELKNHIGNLYIQSNQLAEAEKTLVECQENAVNNFNRVSLECKVLKTIADLRIKQKKLNEAKECLQKVEMMLDQDHYATPESRLMSMHVVAQQYASAGFADDCERVFRKSIEFSASMSPQLALRSRKLLAAFLISAGKTAEASEVLSMSDKKAGAPPNTSTRDELVKQSQLAWGLNTEKRYAEAKEMATKVVNQAHLLMPQCEDSLVLAASVLIEQAKRDDQPDEMLRLVGLLSEYKQSIQLKCVMPTLYLEAATAFAKQRSIRADSLFEQAMKSAEEVQTLSPQGLDVCCYTYMNYCISTRKQEKALQLCDYLMKIRAASSGTASVQYSGALTSKAVLLIASDLQGAEEASAEAVKIFEDLGDNESLALVLTLKVRSDILKKQLRFDEGKALDERLQAIKEGIQKKIAEAGGNS
jgi:tetratricopeptide (TPR) repeat protein